MPVYKLNTSTLSYPSEAESCTSTEWSERVSGLITSAAGSGGREGDVAGTGEEGTYDGAEGNEEVEGVDGAHEDVDHGGTNTLTETPPMTPRTCALPVVSSG